MGRTISASAAESREAAIERMRALVYPAIERLIAEEPGQWVSALSNRMGRAFRPGGQRA